MAWWYTGTVLKAATKFVVSSNDKTLAGNKVKVKARTEESGSVAFMFIDITGLSVNNGNVVTIEVGTSNGDGKKSAVVVVKDCGE